MAVDLKEQVVQAATALGLTDLMDGETPADALAARSDAHPDAVRRLMRGMIHFGLCRQHGDRTFELTAAGKRLLRDAGERSGPGMLLYSVRTGRPAFERAFGVPFFEYTKAHPEAARRFGGLMAVDTKERAVDVATSYDFASATSAVDVGGGHGTLITELLNRHRHLTGILFDVEPVIAAARTRIERAELGPRCRLVAGDFFELLPAGADLYLYSQVLHDWDDEACRTILKICRQAIGPDGRILVIEAPLPERIEEGTPAVELDLMMLMLTGGRERTHREYAELLSSAGFELTRNVPLGAGFAILEARLAPSASEKG